MPTPAQKISLFEAERRQRQIFWGIENGKRKKRRIVFLKKLAVCIALVLIAATIVAVTHQDPLAKYYRHLTGNAVNAVSQRNL